MSEFLENLRGIRDDVARRHREQSFAEGFEAAAEVCFAAVERRMDGLTVQMADGALGSEDQKILAALNALLTEMDRGLRRYSANG